MKYVSFFKQYIHRSMYLVDPYAYSHVVQNLPMQAFVAPASFDPDAQELNIVKKYATYLAQNANARYIFSVLASATTVTIPSGTGISVRYGETISGTETQADTTVTSITWTAGSTKRWVIVNNTAVPSSVTFPTNAVWGYIGNFTCSTITAGNSSFKYLHFYNLDANTNLSGWSFQNAGLTGLLTLPANGTTIPNYFFTNENKVTGTLTIGASYASIGTLAFYNCTGFTGTLTISKSNCVIGQNAFNGASGFTGINFASTCTYSSGAFAFCSGLKGSPIISTAQNNIPDSLYYGCSNLDGSLSVPSNITTIGNQSFYNCGKLNGNFNFLSQITSCGTSAFANCYKFTGTVAIPSSWTSIPNGLLENCTGLTGAVPIGSGITTIGSTAYANDKFGPDIIIPSGVTSIGFQSFYNLQNATGTLAIPSSLATIGANSFTSCSNLTVLSLPSNYSNTFLTFSFTENWTAASLYTSLQNITSGTSGAQKTFTIGATNKARLLAAYPNSETEANARYILIA